MSTEFMAFFIDGPLHRRIQAFQKEGPFLDIIPSQLKFPIMAGNPYFENEKKDYVTTDYITYVRSHKAHRSDRYVGYTYVEGTQE